MRQSDDRSAQLERMISLLLITGVGVSLALEVAGMIIYYVTFGNLNVTQDAAVFIQGHDFFSFIFSVFSGQYHAALPLTLMTSGLIVLMLTPFLRVVSSAFWFGLERNFKYVVITVFVLVVLTLSLSLH